MATSTDGRDGVLGHTTGCRERYPLIAGIPRLLTGPARSLVLRAHGDWFATRSFATLLDPEWSPSPARRAPALTLVERFDREWSAFRAVGTPDQTRIFDRYFDLVPREAFRPDLIALDAGCGGGRWAYQLASRGPRVIAIDLGLSVEVAEQNTRSTGRVACVQADLLDLPIRRGAIDLAYSLGVLHHIGDTAAAIAGLAGTLRPDGLLLAYLYYALDGRSLPYRALFVLADLLRRAISRLPHPAVLVMATAIAAGTYLPVARTARLLRRLGLGGLADRLPLSFYADLSFGTMLNDSLDRFGTTVEKRYSRAEIARLLGEAGITLLRIADAPPYWRVLGRTRGA